MTRYMYHYSDTSCTADSVISDMVGLFRDGSSYVRMFGYGSYRRLPKRQVERPRPKTFVYTRSVLGLGILYLIFIS